MTTSIVLTTADAEELRTGGPEAALWWLDDHAVVSAVRPDDTAIYLTGQLTEDWWTYHGTAAADVLNAAIVATWDQALPWAAADYLNAIILGQ